MTLKYADRRIVKTDALNSRLHIPRGKKPYCSAANGHFFFLYFRFLSISALLD